VPYLCPDCGKYHSGTSKKHSELLEKKIAELADHPAAQPKMKGRKKTEQTFEKTRGTYGPGISDLPEDDEPQ
jgi:cytochrome c553